MSYSQMVKILREINKEKILFINAGAFYIAIEEDAVLLNAKLKLKCSCFQQNTCKVGVPIKSLEKYLEKIEEIGYSYIVYNYENENIKIMKEFKGKENKTKRKNINCLLCKGTSAYSEDKYMEALRRMYEQQAIKKKLEIIPKIEVYIQYMIEVIIKLPRVEKFSIGNEYKISMYKTLEYVMYLNKIEEQKCMYYANLIDAEINAQRIYLRIMYKNKWIDQKKFNVAMQQIYEMGKILGGLIKYYGKNNTK